MLRAVLRQKIGGITLLKNLNAVGLESCYYRKRAVRMAGLIAGVIAAVLFSLALSLEFEPKICFFKHDSILAPIAIVATIVMCVAVLVLPFVILPKQKTEQGVFPEENRYLNYYTTDLTFVKILRMCVAAVIFAQGIVRTVRIFIGVEALPVMPVKEHPSYTMLATIAVLFYAVMLLSLFAFGMYFIPEVADRYPKTNGRLHLILGSLGVFWAALNIINNYYDKSYGLSSQYRLMEQLCFVAVMLATVYEIRYRLDGTKVRTKLATTAAAFVLCFGFNAARVVMMITVGAVNGTDVCNTFMLLALSAYYGARLFFYEED